jgi:predicted Zn-dependent protease with MMP-like domain
MNPISAGYQKNVEAVCCSEAEISHEVLKTMLHELGYDFGRDESQLVGEGSALPPSTLLARTT